jgi:hypothetical protein
MKQRNQQDANSPHVRSWRRLWPQHAALIEAFGCIVLGQVRANFCKALHTQLLLRPCRAGWHRWAKPDGDLFAKMPGLADDVPLAAHADENSRVVDLPVRHANTVQRAKCPQQAADSGQRQGDVDADNAFMELVCIGHQLEQLQR